MVSRKNKANLERRRRKAVSNDLFGIKNIQKVFRVKTADGGERNVQASVWVVYEKSTGNQLAAGKFSQMMDICQLMSRVDPKKAVEPIDAALDEVEAEVLAEAGVEEA